MAKYNVGDRVSNSTTKLTILEILTSSCRKKHEYAERTEIYRVSGGNNFNYLTQHYIDEDFKLMSTKVKATKIAKKVYHDRIVEEKDGILTVRIE